MEIGNGLTESSEQAIAAVGVLDIEGLVALKLSSSFHVIWNIAGCLECEPFEDDQIVILPFLIEFFQRCITFWSCAKQLVRFFKRLKVLKVIISYQRSKCISVLECIQVF